MKSTGIVRRIDELGRIVLPKELRNLLDIKIKDELDIFFDGDRILINKHENACAICNYNENLVTFKDKMICKKCVEAIEKL